MQVTLKDIAARTGFSITTVSRALAGYDDVSEQTRQHIISIADELGYQPNLVARQLQGRRTHTIGLIMSVAAVHHEDFFSLLVRGVTHAAAERGYDMLIAARQPGTTEMDSYRRIVGGGRVDGMVLARTYQNDPRIQYLKSIKHPFVVLGRAAPHMPSEFPFIDVDSQKGIEMLVEHFIVCGHRRIGLILPPPELAFTGYRLFGYQSALATHDLPYREQDVIHGDMTDSGGEAAARTLLKRVPDLTAIVACNDSMALGAMTAIQAAGRTVGDDFALGGFDDIPAAQYASPALTTVRQPIYELGEQLIDVLMAIIARETVPEIHRLLEPELIVRDSSGLCPQTERSQMA